MFSSVSKILFIKFSNVEDYRQALLVCVKTTCLQVKRDNKHFEELLISSKFCNIYYKDKGE